MILFTELPYIDSVKTNNKLDFPEQNKFLIIFESGNGTTSNPYKISNVTQLQNISANLSAHYIIVNDINAALTINWNGGDGFNPIGNITSSFNGSINGQSYTITDLFINSTNLYSGLFGFVGVGGVLINVTMTNISVTGDRQVGGLVGVNQGTVFDCSSTGKVNGYNSVGGLVGQNSLGTVSNCYAINDVDGDDDFIGGLVGFNSYGTVSNCSATGKVNGGNNVGGLVGRNFYGTVSDCYTTGKVNGGNNVGGLLGENSDGTVSDCYSTGKVIGDDLIGGLVGENSDGTVSNCYAKGDVIGNDYIGGLVGGTIGTVSNCHSTGKVIGNSYVGALVGGTFGTVSICHATGDVSGLDNIGGLVGRNTEGTVSNCYATGNVTGGEIVGGLVGKNSKGTVSNCYATGNVTGNEIVGGFVGFTEATVTNCHASGKVSGDWDIGGLVGVNQGTVSNCSATGNVNGNSHVSSLVGSNSHSTVSNCWSTGNVNGNDYVGGLTGANNYSLVSNCTVTGSVSGHNFIGGLLGLNLFSTVSNCFASSDVNGVDNIGGLLGENFGDTVSICTATGDVIGNDFVGGLIGTNKYGKVSYCTATGNVSGVDNIGALIGFNSDTVLNCYSTGDVGGESILGGLIGENNKGMVSYCYATGEVCGDNHVGGLMGTNKDKVSNCFSTGNVIGDRNVGGLIGFNYATVSYCYITCDVSGANYTGALVGQNIGTVLKSFWNIQTSGLITSNVGIGKNTSEMKTKITFTSEGWDFTSIWYMFEGVSYPLLVWCAEVLPIFDTDSTPIMGKTGESFTFSITVSDAAEIQFVYVEYWFGSGIPSNMTMLGTGPYTLTITIPSDSTDALHYIFHAVEDKGYWVETMQKNVIIIDDEKPKFGIDSTPLNGTTGDIFRFNIVVTDNIKIEYVSVEYWFGSSIPSNITMSGSVVFTYEISIPRDSIELLHYLFHASDSSGNLIETLKRNVIISDNDKPIFGKDLTPGSESMGIDIVISIEVTDNIGINSVMVEYWFGSGAHSNRSMSGPFSNEYIITIPNDSTDVLLQYIFHASDISGLWNTTESRTIVLIDFESPVIQLVDDITIYLGQPIQVDLIATDNVGISEYIWDNAPVSYSESTLSGIPTETGIFTVSVKVIDFSGNDASLSFIITILSIDNDEDEDGIPDLVEISYGLDMNNSFDALLDLDDDGLTNLEEYQIGTEINRDDSDNDGMLDGWEVDNNLDPLIYSAENDADGDGKTDLEEYHEGSDPNMSDIDPDEDMFFSILIILIIIVVVIVIVSIGITLIILIRRKKVDTEGEKTIDIENEEHSSKTAEEKAYEDLYGSP